MKRVQYGQQIPVRIELLTEENARLTRCFYCGNPAIDSYFRQEALDDPTAVTYLVIDELNGKLLSALTLSCSAIFLSRKQQLSTLMSAIEVVYFAVDVDYQGMRYRLEGVNGEDGKQLKVTVWPEPFNFFTTSEEEKESSLFDFDEDGIVDAVAWMNNCLFEGHDKYQNASDNWSGYQLK